MSADHPESSAAVDDAPDDRSRGALGRLGADWWAVIVAGVLVLLAGLGLLPSIPFPIK